MTCCGSQLTEYGKGAGDRYSECHPIALPQNVFSSRTAKRGAAASPLVHQPSQASRREQGSCPMRALSVRSGEFSPDNLQHGRVK
jgi:hypothetical protein